MATTLVSSCVTTKKYLISDLQSNFEKNQEKFYEKKGIIDKPEYDIEIIYDDDNLTQEYEVLSYNLVNSVKPFLVFYKNKWYNNKRIFQIFHYGYCTGLIEHSDGLIIEPDLGAFKYVRYKNSSKPLYVEPKKTPYSKAVSIGSGLEIPNDDEYIYTNFGLSFDRKIDCFSSISHGFELGFGLKEKYENGIYLTTYSKNYFRYRLLYKYSISSWLTNTYNVNFKNSDALTFNIGPNFDFLNNRVIKYYESDDIYNKRSKKDPISFGLTLGFDINFSKSISLGIGADYKMCYFNSKRTDVEYNNQGEVDNKDVSGGFEIIPEFEFDNPLLLTFGLKIKI